MISSEKFAAKDSNCVLKSHMKHWKKGFFSKNKILRRMLQKLESKVFLSITFFSTRCLPVELALKTMLACVKLLITIAKMVEMAKNGQIDQNKQNG